MEKIRGLNKTIDIQKNKKDFIKEMIKVFAKHEMNMRENKDKWNDDDFIIELNLYRSAVIDVVNKFNDVDDKFDAKEDKCLIDGFIRSMFKRLPLEFSKENFLIDKYKELMNDCDNLPDRFEVMFSDTEKKSFLRSLKKIKKYYKKYLDAKNENEKLKQAVKIQFGLYDFIKRNFVNKLNNREFYSALIYIGKIEHVIADTNAFLQKLIDMGKEQKINEMTKKIQNGKNE